MVDMDPRGDITITGVATGGFGAQYHACLSVFALSRFRSINYLHTPFFKMDHSQDPFLLNRFCGLRSDQGASTHSPKYIRIKFSEEIHWSSKPSLFYSEDVCREIRNLYFTTPKPSPIDCDVAIHIRRGDVHPDMKQEAFRFLPLDYYQEILNLLKNKYSKTRIAVFSQGNLRDFSSLGLPEENLYLNTDLSQAFHTLSTSKCLVMGMSSLSYAAGLLNSNEVIYARMWHMPLDRWKYINNS